MDHNNKMMSGNREIIGRVRALFVYRYSHKVWPAVNEVNDTIFSSTAFVGEEQVSHLAGYLHMFMLFIGDGRMR